DVLHQEDATRAAGHGDRVRLQHGFFERLDGADVRFRSALTYRDAEGRARQVDIRSGRDAVRGDQIAQALPRHDHDVERRTTRELRGDGLRSAALRGAGASRDLDAARALELWQEFLVRTAEAAGDDHFQ